MLDVDGGQAAERAPDVVGDDDRIDLRDTGSGFADVQPDVFARATGAVGE